MGKFKKNTKDSRMKDNNPLYAPTANIKSNDKPFFIVNQEKNYCSICKKLFYDRSTFNTHYKNTHIDNPKIKCIFCSNSYKYLKKHQKTCALKNRINNTNNIFIHSKQSSYNNSNRVKINDDIIYYKNLCLGSGSTMNVYYGKNIKTNVDLAIKIEQAKNDDITHICFEDSVTKEMSCQLGFPQNFGKFKLSNQELFAETLFGPNLLKIYNFCNQSFSPRTICLIFLGVMKRLETFHNYGFLHNDLKLENLSWGTYKNGLIINKNIINLLDFGSVSTFIKPIYETNKGSNILIGYENFKKEKVHYITGTIDYLDKSVLKYFRTSRKTDIISLLYLVVFMFKGSLPWSSIPSDDLSEKIKKVKSLNKRTKIIELFQDIPLEYYTIYTEVQKLKYEEKPRYSDYYNLVDKLLIKLGGNINEKFCWEPKIEELVNKIENKQNNEEELKKIKNLFEGYPFSIK